MASRVVEGAAAAGAQPIVWHSNNCAVHGASSAPGMAPAASESEQPGRVLMNHQARIQELERELETRPRQAYQQGYNEGQAAGIQQANARVDTVLARLAQSLQDLTAVRKRHLLEAEEDAVRLAVAVARRVLHRELSVDPESLLGVVKAAFERVEARDIHQVRLHPDDIPILQRHLAATGMPPRIELIADMSLERGSVVVETVRGSLDASVGSQLKEIERGLVDLVRKGS